MPGATNLIRGRDRIDCKQLLRPIISAVADCIRDVEKLICAIQRESMLVEYYVVSHKLMMRQYKRLVPEQAAFAMMARMVRRKESFPIRLRIVLDGGTKMQIDSNPRRLRQIQAIEPFALILGDIHAIRGAELTRRPVIPYHRKGTYPQDSEGHAREPARYWH